MRKSKLDKYVPSGKIMVHAIQYTGNNLVELEEALEIKLRDKDGKVQIEYSEGLNLYKGDKGKKYLPLEVGNIYYKEDPDSTIIHMLKEENFYKQYKYYYDKSDKDGKYSVKLLHKPILNKLDMSMSPTEIIINEEQMDLLLELADEIDNKQGCGVIIKVGKKTFEVSLLMFGEQACLVPVKNAGDALCEDGVVRDNSQYFSENKDG